jgi:hypothetical protein
LVQSGWAFICPAADCTGIRGVQGPGGSTIVQQWVPPQLSQSDGVIALQTGYWATLGSLRGPDFLSLNINVGLPWLANLVGPTIAINVDRKGNVYAGPGINVGKSLGIASFSATANWLNQWAQPSGSQLNSFLTSNSFNFTAGYWGGVQFGWTPGSGTSSGAGLVTPQIGITWAYSWKLFNLGIGW